MDHRKRDAVSIVTAVLVYVCSPTIAAPAKSNVQSVRLPAHFHKDISYEGYKDPFYRASSWMIQKTSKRSRRVEIQAMPGC